MSSSTGILNLRPGRAFFQTLLFIIAAFLLSSLSLLLSFVLKNLNPSEYGLIQGNKQDLEITYKELLFFTTVIFAFFLLSLSFRHIRHKVLHVTFVSLAVFYLSASFLIILTDVIYYLIFAYRITFSSVQTILNTTAGEVEGFIKLYYTSGRIVTIILFIAFYIFLVIKRAWFVKLFSTQSFFIASAFVSSIGAIDFMQLAHSKGNGTHNVRYWDIIIGEYNEYNEFNRRLGAEKNMLILSKEYDNFYKQDTLAKTLVMVISESLSKRHMSLYGYPRRTTPRLDMNKSIYKFNDCVTQAALTIEAVPGLFFNGHLEKKINLIALLNKLGYETSWISNQSGWGKNDGTIVLLSQVSEKTVFTDARADDNKSNSSLHYDEAVLGPFNKIMSESAKASRLVVLHLMGCHFDYERRYPANRSLFNSDAPAKTAINTPMSRKIINSYDNAMHYHDSVINQVLRIFEKRSADKNAALVFLSDHGEELYDYRDHAGHGYPPNRVTAEIPYFTMLSDGFKKNYPALEEMMRKRVNTAYSTASNFFTLLHLLNINSKKHKKRILKNAFFSPAYDSTAARMIMGTDYNTLNF